ncbi:MAG: DUF928 domain-containing protein [Cyanobacteria bacterium P01_A01_bin.68]
MKTLNRYIFKRTTSFQYVSSLMLSLVMSVTSFTSFTLAATPTPTPTATNPPRKPPKNTQRRPTGDIHTLGGAERGGCSKEMNIPPLRVLGSRSYFDKASTKPTLAWFVPDSKAYPMKLRIYKYDKKSNNQPNMSKPQPIGNDIEMKSSYGINYLSPEKLPKLEEKEFYSWQVTIECKSGNKFKFVDVAYFETVRVTLPPLQNNLTNTGNSIANKLRFYNEHGYWYEALGEVLKLTKPPKLGNLGATLLMNHAKKEESAITAYKSQAIVSERIKYRIDNLRKIATDYSQLPISVKADQ